MKRHNISKTVWICKIERKYNKNIFDKSDYSRKSYTKSQLEIKEDYLEIKNCPLFWGILATEVVYWQTQFLCLQIVKYDKTFHLIKTNNCYFRFLEWGTIFMATDSWVTCRRNLGAYFKVKCRITRETTPIISKGASGTRGSL